MDTAITIAGIWIALICFILWCVNRWKGGVHLQEMHDEAEGTNWPRGGM